MKEHTQSLRFLDKLEMTRAKA